MHSSSAPVSRRRVSASDLTSPSSEPPLVASARTSCAVSGSAASAGSVQSSSVADIMTQSLMGWVEVTSARLIPRPDDQNPSPGAGPKGPHGSSVLLNGTWYKAGLAGWRRPDDPSVTVSV